MNAMDLDAVLEALHQNLSVSSNTSTTATLLDGLLPTTLLENLVPGYGYIHKIVLQTVGFDITLLVSLFAALWLGSKAFDVLWSWVWTIVGRHWMSDISISSRDEIHDEVIQFLAHKYQMKPSRSLQAETARRGYWDLDNEDAVTLTQLDGTGTIQWLNFADQDSKTKPQYTPSMGASHSFWHNGRYFRVKRSEKMVFSSSSYDKNPVSDQQMLLISCYGRSTTPIKEFLQEAKEYSNRNHSAKTIIRRPATKERRSWGGRSSWIEVARRPCRPMRTVVLDEVMKNKVLRDINEYLNPSTARWYAIRGIPYRRGYLFHGPPGTGKTSLTFALAGVFGLNIYVVSLLEPTLTEEELGNLFTNLPPRCIVLLEDIDTAGLTRVNEDKVESSDECSSDSSSGENEAITKKHKKGKGRGGRGRHSRGSKKSKKSKKDDDDEKKGISLSGLLNIIDGVASHEGRVLVMTTNHPEKLDEALIRPGRVDCQVAFTNATRHQIKEIFERMYSKDPPREKLIAATSPATSPIPQSQTPIKEEDEEKTPLLSRTPETPPQNLETNHANPAANSVPQKRPLTPPDTPITPETETTTETKSPTAIEKKPLTIADIENDGEEEILAPGELSTLATQFAEHIENFMFSPAEVQGFLLTRKKAPRKAVVEIGAWVEVTRKSKVEGQKFS
ncbi:b656ec0f-0a53-4e0e-afed-0cd71481acaa [Sclerotinia trifoliorum]|uniref:B656ec0f-0a53-4e0e-afed-0cd71481acaa n=1 Tax=Sclerotinia trifoliorum TaxID=28548 RepID=A0A8H2W3J5_9HELO|nr:b656ec0f-0a53-4e0e-afed-0cd71481acaa [Sclerotinia trifoliorum]